MDDDELLASWRSGQSAAGQALVRHHYAAVFRFFYGKAPLPVCEDLAQKTFETVCRRPEGYRGEGSFRAYLLGVARYLLLGWRRRERPVEAIEESALPAEQTSPSGALVERETLRLVATALRGLEIDDQILIELKDWEGLSQAELASLFAWPQPTVARRLQRARARLRAAVEALAADGATTALRELDSCLESIRADIAARFGRAMRA
ncbi:sigma-70 family RNA polymerase sigma factor [Nannocystis sp. SCPEA4]|uniref:RNA polymerase sigma factor n=1 Tax=Nannocystis sp. SCPEA4 TaxID=2996787 RepID=UPI0022708CE4|nr:sigma-70 family RNA polymerase sigma factor [Nannocystis sp. SCPEA4]